MAGRGDPPEGAPGAPGGDDDFPGEYRPTVFDEAFVEAARIQEYSAQERIEDEGHTAVRPRGAQHDGPYGAERGDAFFGDPGPAAAGFDASGTATGPYPGHGGTKGGLTASKQGIVLVLLIALAFGTAIYMGIRNPYQGPPKAPVQPLRITLLPLAPRDAVPGGQPGELYAHSPAAQFRTGAEGVTLPPARRTAHFSTSQVLSALTLAKEYVVGSSVDPNVLKGGAVRPVRVLVDPEQQEQFDRSMEAPRENGRQAATGWMIRFDPRQVTLADPRVRVNGTLSVREVAGNALEVTADHVFVYAVRPAGSHKDGEKAEDGKRGDSSLFTVRREVRFRLDHEDLRHQQLGLEQVAMRAGPLPCSANASDVLRPLLAGERAKDDGQAGTDPYARGQSSASMCGVLATSAQPDLGRPPR
ncbi:hypothetical protein [Streptomyces sp. HNM0574]|uniref:SCO2583 family membrane protein n=1 Tax=Streptomyces sp. HNM0574 TaxID=2714954 RepID=UPI00146A6810|nr:hypothetical protein [Streptomyces sp. HNM0574]NLU69104.1 hypothetical protein [Streptomyces sp. HNM0574]